MRTLPRPVRVEPAFADPAAVLDLTRSAGPYWPLARYAASAVEREAAGSPEGGGEAVPPWFRLDFALNGQVLVPGAETILHNPAFLDAAGEVFGSPAHVRPSTVYVNVMGPTAFPFFPHVDVPAFRGFTRAEHPVWLLHQMKVSGLFEDYRIRLATGVSWFYEGEGGSFHYWPDGPTEPAAVEEPPFANVAVVADNEITYHGVSSLGRPDDGSVDALTVEGQLERRVDKGGWAVVEAGQELTTYTDAEVRTTISWKAEVFTDDAELSLVEEHTHDLTLSMVVDRFLGDLRAKGVAASPPADPHRDETWVRSLAETYREPAPHID